MPISRTKKISIDRIIMTSFIVDISDVAINVAMVILTGSVTMLAQALEGISDLISSGLLFLGNKRSKIPSDSNHPYGYGRETYFWALMAGLVTFSITSTFSIYLGYKRYLNPEPIDNLYLALIALSIAFVSNGYSTTLSLKKLVHNKKITNIVNEFLNSPLIEVKTAFVLDLMGTVASVLGLLALFMYKLTGNIRYDSIGSIITGVALGLLSTLILMGAKDLLIGKSASEETLQKIKDAVLDTESVIAIVDLRTIILGSNKLLINLEINVQDDLTTDVLERLIDKVEQNIHNNIDWNASIQIELETI